jgi:hypothetical protein
MGLKQGEGQVDGANVKECSQLRMTEEHILNKVTASDENIKIKVNISATSSKVK